MNFVYWYLFVMRKCKFQKCPETLLVDRHVFLHGTSAILRFVFRLFDSCERMCLEAPSIRNAVWVQSANRRQDPVVS